MNRPATVSREKKHLSAVYPPKSSSAFSQPNLELDQNIFRTVAEHAPDVICRFDQNYTHVYVNPAIERATGVPVVAFMGKTPYELDLPKEFVDYWISKLKYVFDNAEQTTMEFAFPTPKGERHFQSLLVPEHNPGGQVETVLSISRDITEMKQLAKQKDDLLGMVSHELRNPVTSLKAYTQLLHQQFSQSGDLKTADSIARMGLQLTRLNNLINELLDMTRMQQGGKLNLHIQEFDINVLLQEVVDNMQLTTSDHKIEIQGVITHTLFGDRDRVGQVLINLLSNAIKYSRKPQILVHLSEDKQVVTCGVQDFGMGIPKPKLKKVFERFYQVSGQDQQYKGLGLGLFISAEIIKQHDGKIWVESEIGKGSTFRFSIPKLLPIV